MISTAFFRCSRFTRPNGKLPQRPNCVTWCCRSASTLNCRESWTFGKSWSLFSEKRPLSKRSPKPRTACPLQRSFCGAGEWRGRWGPAPSPAAPPFSRAARGRISWASLGSWRSANFPLLRQNPMPSDYYQIISNMKKAKIINRGGKKI